LTGNNRPVGYRNRSIRHFIESNGQSTSDDDQANCFSKLPALACLYAGHPDYLKIAEQCIRVQQTDKIALEYGLTTARLLERILVADENQTVEQTIQDLAKDDRLFAKTLESIDNVNEDNLLHDLIKLLTVEDSSAVLSLGNSCHLPDSFNLSTYFIRTYQQNTDYKSLIRRAVASTGDNCSRILFVGACVGAMTGAKQIPEDWTKKVVSYEKYEQLAQQIIDARAEVQQQK
jgi:ADP-ribosylglycohydrolase